MGLSQEEQNVRMVLFILTMAIVFHSISIAYIFILKQTPTEHRLGAGNLTSLLGGDGWSVESECVEDVNISHVEFTHNLFDRCGWRCFLDKTDSYPSRVNKLWVKHLNELANNCLDVCEKRCMACVDLTEWYAGGAIKCTDALYSCYRECEPEHGCPITNSMFFWNETQCVKVRETLVRIKKN